MSALPSLAGQKLPDVLRLTRTEGVGAVTFFSLLQRFKTAGDALAALPDLSKRGGRKKPLTPITLAEAEAEIEAAETFGARLVMFGEDDYPPLLTRIPDPPPVITIMGNANLWKDRLTVALVGARSASAGGCQMAQQLARQLGENRVTVVSGLARGIDTFVHRGSVASGTVAVIAGGIDNIYPPENQMLYMQIREMGCLISEQPFGAIPFANAFPSRNRIIAGLSLGTVVVEASPKSGSLITARLAGEYNREVLAVPGSPLDPRSKGCNQLIRQGAVLVESASDIIQALDPLRERALSEEPAPTFTHDERPPSDVELARARAAVLEKLAVTPVSVDELIAQCELPAPLVLMVLLELELAGRARRSAGGKVGLAADHSEGNNVFGS